MLKSIYTKLVFTVVVSAFVLAACGKDKDGAGKASVLSSNDTILRYVPADTPYILANVEPLPDELMDKLEPKIDRVLQSYQTVLREIVTAKLNEPGNDEHDAEETKKITAVIDELTSLLSIEGLRGAGVGRDATGAIYGNGLLPVVRFTLSDGALFDAAIARIEEKAGHKLPVASIEGGAYRYFDADDLRIIIAVFSDQAVITGVPGSFGDAQIATALGLTLPETSIAEAGVLESIANEYGFTAHYAGFVDVEAVASTFIDTPTGLNADLLALTKHDSAELSDVCKAEIRALSSVAPRMVLGYTEIGVERLDSNFVVEFRDDIAAGLALLPAPIPGLGGDQGGLMSFGLSFDVKAAREFLEARVAALETAPFECEHFAELQHSVAGARAGLNQPLPPMVYDFKGILAVIEEIEGLDVATQTPPTSMEGRFMLAMDNAPALVTMGSMFVPQLADLNLQADGKPVVLDMPQMQGMGISAYAALTEGAIAIAVGEESEADIAGLLSAEVPETAPFMSVSIDASRYYSFLGDAIATAPRKDDEHGPSPEMQAALKEIMSAIADLYDRMTVDVLLTERGAEIQSSVTLKD